MSLSILRSSLGRLSLQNNVASTINRVSSVAATCSFMTTSVFSEPKAAKKPTKTTAKPKATATNPKVVKVKTPRVLKKDLKMPHKSFLTPWVDFLGKYQAEHRKAGTSSTSVSTDAAAVWHTMSAEEKSKYGTPAEEKAKLLEMNKEYRKTPQYRAAAKLYKKKLPAKALMTGYALFVKDTYDSSLNFQENGLVLGKKWHSMIEEEKEVYKQRARLINAEKAEAAAEKAKAEI